MAYTATITYLGEQSFMGHRSIAADVAITGTDSTDYKHVEVNVSHTDGPYDGTNYASPVFVALTRTDHTDDDVSGTSGEGHTASLVWDKANDSTSSGTIRVLVVNGSTTNDNLAGLNFRVMMFFNRQKRGGVS